MQRLTDEDKAKILDWLIILALGSGALLVLSVVLGVAVRLFVEVGGI